MKTLYLLLCVPLLTGCAGKTEVQGERMTIGPGGAVIDDCGEGASLPECRDYNNLTYSENLEYNAPTDEQMEKEAAKVRAESPEQLERTISDLEQNPDIVDTSPE